MKEDAARSELLERVFELDPEDFEHLCKILVEQTEQPHTIELTPFRADGGIDVRGAIGSSFYEAKFGVQVKRFNGRVGTPAMRNFIGALSQHDYQFGAFITSSEFSSGAIEVATEQYAHPIQLVNGEELTNIMLSNQLGVDQEQESYEIDEEFWGIFGTTAAEKGLVKSDAVPQADSLDILNLVLKGMSVGYRVKSRIREHMTARSDRVWSPRQADYYAQALWALGYVHKDAETEYDGRTVRQWGLTRDGEEYLRYITTGDDERASNDFIEHIRDADIISPVLSEIEASGPISHDRLGTIIQEQSELNDTTAGRRRGTVGTWLSMLPEIRRYRNSHTLEYEYLAQNLSDF
jgi:restriction system protein